MKIYFASDAHLGARFHKDPLAIEKKLVRWLDSIKEDASAIWFLGDLFDYWYEYKYVVKYISLSVTMTSGCSATCRKR